MFPTFPSPPAAPSPTMSEVVDESEQDSPGDNETLEAEEVPAQASSSEVLAPASGVVAPLEAQPAVPSSAPVLRRSLRGKSWSPSLLHGRHACVTT